MIVYLSLRSHVPRNNECIFFIIDAESVSSLEICAGFDDLTTPNNENDQKKVWAKYSTKYIHPIEKGLLGEPGTACNITDTSMSPFNQPIFDK